MKLRSIQLLSFLFAFVMIFGMMSLTAFSAENNAHTHTYKSGVCTGCGEEHPNLKNYEGKVISILGDSISTFAGYIPVADGFNLEHYARYPQSNLFTEVEHTWWMQVLTALNAKLGINESWRSTEVGNIYDVEVNSGYEGTKACMASTTRIQNLGSNGSPDVILFYGGTNDITQRRTIGTFDPENAPVTVDLTSVKWDTVADAYVAAIMRMQYYYPNAEIIAMLPTFTSNNTDAVIEKYNTVFATICEHYCVTYIDLRECGITTSDLPDGTHPNEKGMDYISAAVLDALLSECNVKVGENIVHPVTHNLSGAKSSLSYYKGVSHGKSFVTTISGDDLTVTVSMGGADITDSVYVDGIVSIPCVTGDVIIEASGKANPIYYDHVQQLPNVLCSNVNLWDALEPKNGYFYETGWVTNYYSITIPITAEYQLWATSFQKSSTNGGSRNGIRLTWFSADGVLKSMSPDEVYSEFSANGCLTAPEGTVAANVVMWNNNDDNEVYILNQDHVYKNGVCIGCGEEHPNLENYESKVISVLGDSISTFKGYIPTADGFNEAHPSTYPSRDVQSWDKTWWGLVIDRLDAKLGINDSWSGSRVQNTYNAENPGGNVGTKVCMSSMTRISNLGTNGTPDVILVYGGTNDGKFSKFGGFDPNQDYSQVDLDAVTWSTFEEAYVAMIMRLQYLYPNAKIVVVLPTHVSSWYTDEKLEIMNTSIKQICEYFDIEYVNTPECGITLEDLPDGLHPNAKGMEYIANAVLDIMLNSNEITKGENIVHSIEHKLNGVTASNGHYKGISSNNTFAEKLTGNPECVRVTMNGVDITADCYKEGNIYIESVSGDVIITAKQHNYDIAVTPPTCTEQGFTTYTCDCGDIYIDDYKDATGEHTYENGVCTECGDVKPGPTITKQPVSAVKKLGERFTLTVEAEGDGLTYQWYYKDASMKEFEKSSVKGATYSFEMLGFRVGREYYCVISDKYGNSVKTDIVKSTTPLAIIEQPQDSLVNIGEQVDIRVKAIGEGLSYQWYYKEREDAEFSKSVFTGTKYSRSMMEFCHERQVYCIITDAYGNSVQTDTAEMRRPPKELTIIEQPEDVQAEIGEKFEITVETDGDELTYQWYYKDAYMDDFEISVNKTSSYSYTMTEYRHNRQVYCIITDKYGNTVKTKVATIRRTY